MAPSTTQRLFAVNEQLKKLHADKRRLLAKQTKATRKADARRKILIGACVLSDEQLRAIVLPLLDDQLKRADERALFDLPPLAG